MSILACLLTLGLAAVSVEFSPDQPAGVLFTDEPVVLAVESTESKMADLDLRVQVPGQPVQEIEVELFWVEAGKRRWISVPIEAFSGPHRFEARILDSEGMRTFTAERMRLHRPGRDRGFRPLVHQTSRSISSASFLPFLNPIGISQQETVALLSPTIQRLGIPVYELRVPDDMAIAASQRGPVLAKLQRPKDVLALFGRAYQPHLDGVVYSPIDTHVDTRSWRAIHHIYGETRPFAAWHVDSSDNASTLAGLLHAREANVVQASLDLVGIIERPEALAEASAWNYHMTDAKFVGGLEVDQTFSAPLLRKASGSWVLIVSDVEQLHRVTAQLEQEAITVFDRFGNPWRPSIASPDVPPRYVMGSDANVLNLATLNALEQEATHLLSEWSASDTVPQAFVVAIKRLVESTSEPTRRDYFQLLTLFPEIVTLEQSLDSSAYLRAEFQLSRLVRLLSALQESSQETFIESVAERKRRVDSLENELAGPEGLVVDFVGEVLIRSVRDWLTTASTLQELERSNEARALAAAAEWRMRGVRARILHSTEKAPEEKP